jgi:hypothetical protein
MEIGELKQLLIQSWDIETCSPGLRDKLTEEKPSLGQCAITTLIVNDFFGGKIMRCMASSGIHYYNIIDDELVDLTVEQFLGEIPQYEHGEEITRDYLLSNEDTKKRYILLNNNLQKTIGEKLTPEERLYIKSLVSKSCDTCLNGSCRVESFEKVGLDEDGKLQGSNCLGWENNRIIGEYKMLKLNKKNCSTKNN